MRVAFFASEKPREQLLGQAFIRGVARHGDRGHVIPNDARVAEGYDVAAMVGVKSREIFEANWRAGVHVIMLDKGYTRHRGGPDGLWKYWRVAVDAHHPTRTLMNEPRSRRRLEALRLQFQPWRETGDHIVIAGSSAKYHAFYKLPDPTTYAHELVEQIRQITARPILYRPKPSWKDAVKVNGAEWSGPKQSLNEALHGAWCMVTHGSNACFESVLAGVPVIVLGDAVARPISSTDIAKIENPLLASSAERKRWLAALSYCQFTMDEFAGGKAWSILRPQITGNVDAPQELP